MLLSIPCIEAINESISTPEGEWLDPAAYCEDLLGRCGGKSTVDYFKEHAKELLLSHLDYDGSVFALRDFIDWPIFLVNNLEKYYECKTSEDKRGTLLYRHFTSLAYIMLGVVRKYHLEENSTELLRELIETLF